MVAGVKLRFSSLDVCATVASLRRVIVGYRIANIYDINPKTYVLKLQKPDSKLLLLVAAARRCCSLLRLAARCCCSSLLRCALPLAARRVHLESWCSPWWREG